MPESLFHVSPRNWETMTLMDICVHGGGDIQTGPFGSQLHAADYVPDGVPSIMPQNIGDNLIIEDSIARISEEDASRLSKYLVRVGDIVYSRRGDVERRSLVRDRESGWLCGTGCLRIRPGEGAHSLFLSYYLGHPAVRAWIVRHAVGATMPNLNTKILGAVPVVLPSKDEQRSIAAVLGALDDKIAVNEQIVDTALTLACLRYAVFVADEARVGQQRIGEVADVFDGPHATPKKTEHGPWFLGIGSLSHGLLDLDSSAHLSDEDFTRWTRRVTPRAGDVLFSYETRLGVASLMPPDMRACLGRRMALMRPIDDRVGSATLLHAYLVDEFQETIRKRTIHGATVDRIPLTDLPSWTITLPLPEYRPIVERALSALHRTIETRQQENRALAELRDTLLPKLISGELRIRDAERHVADVI
ncbi:restriction endonuclease subunit S [Actinophytocola sp.]|uniref:restriction endonuclease subunit S n=1 Tax=Actinophytocola sp. TaxID=1872138 RepID=UPI0025BEA862|nr:restriction endonuclease subunit S [Actinophytocola sp.]